MHVEQQVRENLLLKEINKKLKDVKRNHSQILYKKALQARNHSL